MLKVTALYVYPIKSLGGIALKEAQLSETGFAYDRYWMLVDETGKFLTQRDFPQMALFKVSIKEDYMRVSYKEESIHIPKEMSIKETMMCTIWGTTVSTWPEDDTINTWFSRQLKSKVLLVRKSDDQPRVVRNYVDSYVNFPDSSQYLIFGEASIKHLNSQLETALLSNRFRPNIVFSGGSAHEEDNWENISIGGATFEINKACARCNITNINQETAEVGQEPIRTLARYRMQDKKIYFGQYLTLTAGNGMHLRIGDEVTHKILSKN